VSADDRTVAHVDGGRAEPEPGLDPADAPVRAVGDDLILRCPAGQPKVFTVRPEP
jgi:hypothetical protein